MTAETEPIETDAKTPGLEARLRTMLGELSEGSGPDFDLMRSYRTGSVTVHRSDRELPLATCQSLPKAEELLRGLMLARS